MLNNVEVYGSAGLEDLQKSLTLVRNVVDEYGFGDGRNPDLVFLAYTFGKFSEPTHPDKALVFNQFVDHYFPRKHTHYGFGWKWFFLFVQLKETKPWLVNAPSEKSCCGFISICF